MSLKQKSAEPACQVKSLQSNSVNWKDQLPLEHLLSRGVRVSARSITQSYAREGLTKWGPRHCECRELCLVPPRCNAHYSPLCERFPTTLLLNAHWKMINNKPRAELCFVQQEKKINNSVIICAVAIHTPTLLLGLLEGNLLSCQKQRLP